MWRINTGMNGGPYYARHPDIDAGVLRFTSIETGNRKAIGPGCAWMMTEMAADDLPPKVKASAESVTEVTG